MGDVDGEANGVLGIEVPGNDGGVSVVRGDRRRRGGDGSVLCFTAARTIFLTISTMTFCFLDSAHSSESEDSTTSAFIFFARGLTSFQAPER